MTDNKNVVLSNGVRMPSVMLGTFQLNNEARLYDLVDAAFCVGFSGFDTAPSYKNEALLGAALASYAKSHNIRREEYFLTDKIDVLQMYDTQGNVEHVVEQQLKKLGTDYIDLLLIHWPYDRYLIETWNTMERLYADGRVRAIGLCNAQRRHIEKVLANAKETGPLVVQNEISPLCANTEAVAYCAQQGIAVEAYSPLCRMHSSIAEDVNINAMARKYEKSVGQVVLRWHVQRGIIPVFMSRKKSRIQENTDIFDFSLTEEEMQMIGRLDQDYHIFPPSYACPGY
jgi:diketogulonate reductase-like aldo/keto reductase